MKKFISEFLRRGLVSCGLGPFILSILYLLLQQTAGIEILTVNQVCTGIFSITVLAFIVGGMNAIYQIEHLPLMIAILIHGSILYISYLTTYLINNWLEWDSTPILAFSFAFLVGYFIIWVIIYTVTKRNTAKMNEVLKKKQKDI